jgi:hypothetical protein
MPRRGVTNKQYLKKRGGKPVKTKKYNFAKIRKFRVAVIAVYFALLFPKYANKFTLRRLKVHEAEFSNKESRKATLSQGLIDEMLKVNVVKIAQDVRMARMDRTNRKVGKSAKLVITEQYDGKHNFEFYIGDIELFLLKYLN